MRFERLWLALLSLSGGLALAACSGDAVIGAASSTTSTASSTGGGTMASSVGVGGGGSGGVGGNGGSVGGSIGGSIGGSGGSPGVGGGAGGPTVMTLDPTTLQVFELPIGSIRYAVTGQDNASNTCVAFIWFGNGPGQICAGPTMENWPYIVVTPNAQAPCMQWDYYGNVMVDQASGCVQFNTSTMPPTALVDVSVNVSGALFTGTIVVDNTP